MKRRFPTAPCCAWVTPVRGLTHAPKATASPRLDPNPSAARAALPDAGEVVAQPDESFELGEPDWTDPASDPGGIEFNLPISERIALLREIGFEIDNYVGVKAPDSAVDVG